MSKTTNQMKAWRGVMSIVILIILMSSASIGMRAQTISKRIVLETTHGEIELGLYDETPQHRDNMLKLVAEHFYDGTLFHRVIKDFMIQGGDPSSRGAQAGAMLGAGGPRYTLAAEFSDSLFHKRGALAAAREGDMTNPERRSSGSQFYIVWGRKYSAGQMNNMQKRKLQEARQAYFDGLCRLHIAELRQLDAARDTAGLQALVNQLGEQATAAVPSIPALSAKQMEAYTQVGGTPQLDGAYTVFGEVLRGLEVVGEIQQQACDAHDRPTTDIVITRAYVKE